MSLQLDQLLGDLARGRLAAAAACMQMEELLRLDPQQARQFTARVQTEVLERRLTHEHGRALLAVLEGDASNTEVLGGRKDSVIEPTLVRQVTDADATSVHTDRTVRKSADEAEATAMRSARTPVDATLRSDPPPVAGVGQEERTPTGDPDATIRTKRAALVDETSLRTRADATLRISGDTSVPSTLVGKSSVTDADDTVRTHRQSAPGDTAARTLQMPTGGASAYAPTLQTPERTAVMGERLAATLGAGEQVQHGTLQPGSIIKQRFVLDTMIGKGGMGLVFGAIDRRKEEAQDPNPRVALKVLNADFQRHPQSFMALQREARKAQSLAHPNVVTVFDFDCDGDAVYMTMELLTGRSLDAVVREARGKGIGREVALPIIRGIAEGLAYAHRKGIVHSDLKPGNVYITDDGTAKILDFGIARAVPSSVTEANQDVFDAGSLGAYTEAYATDEMVDGIDPHPADDLYALGLIGYELLIGFHPYQRHSAPNSRKLGLKPPPLKGLKRREAQALERCLSFDRKDRPKDAAEFLKLFRGVTPLQKATLAATAVLAVASGYLWYENYLETSPARPFAELPQATQAQFAQLMQQGDEEWAFFRRENNPAALQSAVDRYAQAYALHPRNRDAVKALRRTADAFLATAAGQPEQRREIADYLQQQSDYYRKYEAVVDAAE